MGQYFSNGVCVAQTSTTSIAASSTTIPSNTATTSAATTIPSNTATTSTAASTASSTVPTTTAPSCPGGSAYNATSGVCRCPVGDYFYPNGVCTPGSPSCPSGSSYNAAYNACVCSAGLYFSGGACTAPLQITFPSNTFYSSNSPVLKNYTSVSALPTNTLRNISAAIGVQVQVVANGFSFNGAGIVNLQVGCLSCNSVGGSPPNGANGVITGFVTNGILSNATFLKQAIASNIVSNSTLKNIANALAQNAILFKQLVNNYTPAGFRANLNSSTITPQNATAYVARWAASGNATNAYVNISSYKAIAASRNLSAVPLAQKVAAAYVASAFNKTNIVNRTVTQQVYVSQVISGNKTVARYTPTNVTVYRSQNATVISVTNVGSGYSTQVTIPKTTVLVRNVSFSTKLNFSASAISIKTASNTSGVIPKPIALNAAKVVGYLVVNSTINDSSIRSVNYTFNVTNAWLVQNKINPRNVSLYRYNTSTQQWTRLPTVLVASNATSYVYRAASPGMSFYAITGSPINITAANVAITIQPSNVSTNSTSQQSPAPYNRAVQLALTVGVVAMIVILFILGRPRSGTPPRSQEEEEQPPAPSDASTARQAKY